MSERNPKITLTLVATPELLKCALAGIGRDHYPLQVLGAYLESLEPITEPLSLDPMTIVNDIKISPYSWLAGANGFVFEGNIFKTPDDITDYVVDNHYGLVTDEENQMVYYIEY